MKYNDIRQDTVNYKEHYLQCKLLRPKFTGAQLSMIIRVQSVSSSPLSDERPHVALLAEGEKKAVHMDHLVKPTRVILERI